MNSVDYIPASDFACHIFLQYDKPYYVLHRRVLIANIKIDKSLMDFPNPVYPETVEIILEHFDVDQWAPVLLNEDGFLRDGQHRLEVASRLDLKFIDVFVENHALCYPTKVKKPRKKKVAS